LFGLFNPFHKLQKNGSKIILSIQHIMTQIIICAFYASLQFHLTERLFIAIISQQELHS
jgi:hypothetical protein